MSRNYIHRDDAFIERKAGRLEIHDSDGTAPVILPGGLSDDQALICLNAVNAAYSKGVDVGQRIKAREVTAVLGLAA